MLMTMRFALAAALLALVGCGVAQGEGGDPAPNLDINATDADINLVDKAEADLILYVSNQSFDDEEVRLTVTIDGVTVVDGDFHVEGQHNWVSFPLALSSGEHAIRAESDSDATLHESFEIRQGKTRYAGIDHWGEDDSAGLTWQSQWRPMAFA
jgi:hypothetical protein